MKKQPIRSLKLQPGGMPLPFPGWGSGGDQNHSLSPPCTAILPQPSPATITHQPDPTWSRVFEDRVFIVKLLPVDGLAPGAVVVGEITALAHELGDDAVEAAALKPKPFSWVYRQRRFSGAEKGKGT